MSNDNQHAGPAPVVIATPRAGYGHGLRQPYFTASLHVDRAASLDFAAVDAWLDKAFGLGAQVSQAPRAAGPAAQAEARTFAWRVLVLGAALLRAVRVPVFEPGRVLEVAPREGGASWDVLVAIVRVDHVPEKVYAGAYESAAKAMRWMAANRETPDSTAQLWDSLDRGFVKPLQSLGGGESTLGLLEAAFQEHIPFRHLGSGTYQLGWGRPSRRFDRGAIQFDSAIGARMAQDKFIAAALLHDAGLPAPVHVVASSLSKRVLVERQVAGTCHRVVVTGDKVLLVSKRHAKSVKGDGVHTVCELVRAANDVETAKPPWDRFKPFALDDLALECLAAVKLQPDSVRAWSPSWICSRRW